MKQPSDFRNASLERNLTEWPSHKCQYCGYLCKWLFRDGTVAFDVGCNCTKGENVIESRTWGDVARHYNMQVSPAVIMTMNEFWGFQR